MRTITLELLRHGPPHNQLLSPLTQYLALCGNHSGTTVRVPFEHKQVLTRLRALSYKDTDETRKLQLEDTAQAMGEVLAQVPGLIAELAEGSVHPRSTSKQGGEGTAHGGTTLAHFRLILSASELALLPFELATAPNGFPGAGQPLALQAQLPLCITREVRRVSNEQFEWPRDPRILFIGAGDVPFQEHLDALLEVINPWVGHYDEQTQRQKIEEHLVILPEANVDRVQAACAGRNFTHVHMLAHGMQVPGEEDDRFGIALRDAREPGKFDVVDGVRLAALLRTPGSGGVARSPAVVTLANCESAAQGDVVGAASSIAHALHEAGIPLVIGSQFPLSKAASVLLVEVLYKELLWGADPRWLLWDLRGQLRSRISNTHDWASLVVYAAFPSSIESQLDEVRLRRARQSINAAMEHADHAINLMSTTVTNQRSRRTSPQTPPPQDSAINALREARQRIQAAKDHLASIRAGEGEEKTEYWGLQASTEKREGEMLYRATINLDQIRGVTQLWDQYQRDALECLRRSRDYYRKGFEADPASSWSLVQFMVLDAVLRPERPVQADWWVTARVLADQELYNDDRRKVAWAHGSLIELHLLAQLAPNVAGLPEPVKAQQIALEHAQTLRRSPEKFDVYTTARQILRYMEWFSDPTMLPALVPSASAIYDILTDGG